MIRKGIATPAEMAANNPAGYGTGAEHQSVDSSCEDVVPTGRVAIADASLFLTGTEEFSLICLFELFVGQLEPCSQQLPGI